jgi:DNA-binding XRE family transcriptional regulator
LISKKSLAKMSGLSPLTINRIENEAPCRIDTKRKILLGLGLELSDKEKVFRDD